ncbi:ABC transporter substrate-binding protein [Streptomyces sp. AcE210]|uniref:ABC transporter substrate-binding protein n=1 Tax=Streptomyces sp. AcE210 TaxID=2292703 RepID=UPI000E304F63|nr:ABC transporter substrate-binding protein [Streptomyces sp. AcE210]RFC71412.1 ABC transporter substrate-binding protein [Streptomyces sp. AcE210]
MSRTLVPWRRYLLVRRTAVAVTAVALVLSTTAGCGSLQSSATEVGGERMTDDRPVRDGGTLTVALNADPDKLDPSLAQTLVGRTVFAGMCEKLYDVDEAGKVVPQLATALPKTSADGRTVTFSVRKGLKFSDGTSLDAAAVVTSLLRHRDLPGSARATELTPLKSAEATGAYSVKLTLKQAYVPLTAVLADRSGMVMSPAALKKYGKNFTNHPSCVGPFKFVERVGGDRIVLAKDPNYYDARDVHLDKVIYKPIPDGSVRLANLRSGDIQVGDQMVPVDVKSALTDNKLQLFNSPSLGYQGIGINVGNVKGLGQAPGHVDSPLANDVRVREAFELSIDRALINKVVFQGMYEPACGPISPESALAPGVKASQCPERDVAKAKRLLKQAGVKAPVHVELKTSTTPEWSRIGQVIQAMAKDAGFAVTLRPTEYATMLEETDDGHYQAFNSGWSGRLDPDGNIASFLQTKGAMNAYGLSDDKIDALIERGRTEADPAERAKIYGELTRRANDAHALIYLYRQKNYVVAGQDVAGVRVYGDGLIRVKDAGYAK